MTTYSLKEVPAMLKYWKHYGERTFAEPDIAYGQAKELMKAAMASPYGAQLANTELHQGFFSLLDGHESVRKIKKDSVFTHSPIPLRKLQWAVGTDLNFWSNPRLDKKRIIKALTGQGDMNTALISTAYSPDADSVVSLDVVFLKINPQVQDQLLLQIVTLPNYSGKNIVAESYLPIVAHGSVFINNMASYRVSADSRRLIFDHQGEVQELHSAGNLNGRQIFFSSSYEDLELR